MHTVQYPNVGLNIVYPALGLAGEAGEVADKIKKHWRNQYGKQILSSMDARTLTGDEQDELIKEMGDVLWYLAALAFELGTTLEHVAQANISKLTKRAAEGTILGSGDNR